MKKNLHDWMLHREGEAIPRLDALRAEALAPRASAVEVLAALFRPAGAWITLLLIWSALLATNHLANQVSREPRLSGLNAANATLAALLPNETPAPPNPHS